MEDEASAETLADGAAGKRPTPVPGTLPTIDKNLYTIDREIARGGMGRIFTARDRRLDRDVAVKEVIADEAALVARFDREVRLTARLQHPGIVSIYEAGKWTTGEPFYAMRLIDGRPLHDVIKEATTLAARLALLPNILAVAEAMAYAHGKRVIHRDLKPQNILVGRYGETVVIDWGLAKDLDDAAAESLPGVSAGSSDSLTVFGSVMGTPSYMAVEQATGQLVDERADVYAIGSILYQTLAGTPPYTGKSADRVLDALVAGPPPKLTNVQKDVPDDLVAIVERAMARDTRERYRTAQELADDLRRYTTGQLVRSHAYTTRELMARWLKRHRGAVAVGGIAGLALVAIAGASYAKVVHERDRADGERDVAVTARKDAESAQAAMLLDRARVLVAAGTPARAAPLLAAATDLGADGPLVDVLAGEVAAALPAKLATHGAMPGADPVEVKELVAKTGTSGEASAALDPTGKLLAIATPLELALWDTDTMTKRASATGCTDEDQALDVSAVTSAGTVVGVCRALDGSNARALAVWTAGGPLVVGDSTTDGLADVVASRDGRVIGAVETAIGSPRLLRDGKRVSLGTFPAVTHIAVSDDGSLAATGTAQGLVQVWEVGSGRELAVVDLGEPVVALSLDRELAAKGKRGALSSWPLAQLAKPTRIGADSDRTIVALRGTDKGIRWATATAHDIIALDDTGATTGTLAAPSGAVFDAGATIGASGLLAAVAHRGDPNAGGTASAVFANAEVALAEPRPLGATLSDDDRYVFAGGQIIEVASKRVVGTQTPMTSACFTPRSDRAACLADWKGNGNQQVALYHLPDGARLEPPRVAHPLPAAAVVFAGTHDAVYIGACSDELSVISVETAEVLAPIPLEQSACVRDLEVSEASGVGVAALASRRVVVFDVASGKRTGTIVLDGDLEALAMSPTGGYVALATTDGRIGIYDARAHALVAMLHVDSEASGALNLRLAFLTDAELVATTEHRAWRIPWTLPRPDPGWRTRTPFVRDGLDVVLGPR